MSRPTLYVTRKNSFRPHAAGYIGCAAGHTRLTVPTRARTWNLRLRKPTRYPIAPWGQPPQSSVTGANIEQQPPRMRALPAEPASRPDTPRGSAVTGVTLMGSGEVRRKPLLYMGMWVPGSFGTCNPHATRLNCYLGFRRWRSAQAASRGMDMRLLEQGANDTQWS